MDPKLSVARRCGHMANPSWSVNAFAKHIILHLYQYPLPVTWGGDKSMKSLVLAQPTIKPYTPGAKEYGLHFAADAAPGPTAKGITGGVGMLAGGAIDTISARQHLAASDMHKMEITAAAMDKQRGVRRERCAGKGDGWRYRQEALKLCRQTCRPGTQLTSAESCGSNIACCCADVGGYE